MRNTKGNTDRFPHIKGLVRKATKFGHRWILSAPDSTGKIKNITVKISDNDSIEDFYAKVSEARDTLARRETRKTFQAWIEEYIIVRQLAKNSISALRINLRGFGLNNAMNREQVKAILTSGLKISTIKHKIGQINSFFSWLNHKVPEIQNPAIDVKIKANVEPRKRTATDDEIAALLARIKRRKNKEYLLFALLLIHTGARVSTICEVKANDMTSDNHLRLYNVKSKKAYDYLIPINDEETLSLWREVTADGKLWHQPTKVLYRKLKKLMERMFEPDENGERLSVHSLRHTFASKALRSGLPIEVVSKLLDHKSVSTTLAVYARFSQSQIDDAIQKISKN